MRFDVLVRAEDLALNVNVRAALSLLGFKRGRTKAPEKVRTLLESCLAEGMELARPVGAYRARRLERAGDGQFLVVGSRVRLTGRSMERLLKDCFGVVFLAVTIGPELEQRVAEYAASGRSDRAVVLDAVGSELAEAAAVALNDRIRTEARQRGWGLTRRFSPGYGDLSLAVQHDLAQELGLADLGVAVTGTNMLVPQKSVTALVGLR